MKGLKSLNRKLTRTIPERVINKTRKAMEKSADEMVAMMRNLVPVESGALRASIGWTWGDAPDGAIALMTSSANSHGIKITIFAGSRDKALGHLDAFYAPFVEFGTINAAAQPFFYPSYRALKKRAKSRIKRAMRKAIKDGAAS